MPGLSSSSYSGAVNQPSYNAAFSATCVDGRPDFQVPLAFLPRPIFFASADLVAV